MPKISLYFLHCLKLPVLPQLRAWMRGGSQEKLQALLLLFSICSLNMDFNLLLLLFNLTVHNFGSESQVGCAARCESGCQPLLTVHLTAGPAVLALLQHAQGFAHSSAIASLISWTS